LPGSYRLPSIVSHRSQDESCTRIKFSAILQLFARPISWEPISAIAAAAGPRHDMRHDGDRTPVTLGTLPPHSPGLPRAAHSAESVAGAMRCQQRGARYVRATMLGLRAPFRSAPVSPRAKMPQTLRRALVTAQTIVPG
jgi:hypothetical protein